MNRPATGRPRSTDAHRAILEATAGLLGEHGYAGLTIDKVAARAGVSKRTIYRWWSTKGALVAEAFSEQAHQRHPTVDSGRLDDDLRTYFERLFADLAQPGKPAALRSMMAEAQLDSAFAAEFSTFVATRRDVLRTILSRGVERGEIRADTDLEVTIDALFGTYWYRLLVGHLPLDRRLADTLVEQLLGGLRRNPRSGESVALP